MHHNSAKTQRDLSLDITIYDAEDGLCDEDGELGVFVYYKIHNKHPFDVSIRVDELYVIDNEDIQIDKQYWISDYDIFKTTIKSNTAKLTGAVYAGKRVCKIESIKSIGITVQDLTNKVKYIVLYRKCESKGNVIWFPLRYDRIEQQTKKKSKD